MGKSCIIKNCVVRAGDSLSFHRFPLDLELRKLWIECIGERNLDHAKLKRDSLICSRHFNDECLEKFVGCRTILKSNALPTKSFPYTQSLPQTPKRSWPKRNFNMLEVINQNLNFDANEDGTYKDFEHFYDMNMSVEDIAGTDDTMMNTTVLKLDETYDSSNKSFATNFVPDDFDLIEPTDNNKNLDQQSLLDNRDAVDLENEIQVNDRDDMKTAFCSDCVLEESKLCQQAAQYKSKYSNAVKKINKYKAKIRVLQMRLSRKNKKVKRFEDVLDAARKENLLNDNCKFLLDNLPVKKQEILKLWLEQKRPREYPPIVKEFAINLNFLSPKAYEFVRKVFTILPHSSTVSKWYRHVNGGPGFIPEALEALRKRQEISPVIVSIIFDEMSIRKCVEFDGKTTRGFVDFGLNDGLQQDDNNLATQAIVYMAVALNDNFKIPVAYFFINSLSGSEKASILKNVVEQVSATGAKIAAVVCDGCKANLTMAEELGVNFKTVNTKMNFENQETYFILDNCHMLKLLRNAFAELNIFVDSSGRLIKFEYLKKLHELQEMEQLTLANKISNNHINFQNQKMKVRFATQIFSSSVADAIDFCRQQQYPGFEDSEATTEFLRVVDRLFDIFNTKGIFGTGFKSPLKIENQHVWNPILDNAFIYISGIKTENGGLLINSLRKTGFIGYMTLIRSTQEIFNTYVKNGDMKYLLMYKACQDHVELFFSAVRSRGGFNNNPSCSQFIATFKRLITHVDLNISKRSNCLRQDSTKILFIHSSTTDKVTEDEASNECCNFDNVIYDSNLSTYVENVVEYIGGFIVRSILKKTQCTDCFYLLVSSGERWKFTEYKNRGGLISPSPDVVRICKKVESKLRANSGSERISPIREKRILVRYQNEIMGELIQDIFKNDSPNHDTMFESDESHKVRLTKMIVEIFLKIRMHHINKLHNEKIKGDGIRQKFNKLILFKNQ